MLGSVVLDVAIGMTFVYLLLSLIASSLLEILAALIQTRAANLQRGIRSLLSADSIQAGTTLAESVYKHGLIRGLYQDDIKTGWWSQFRLVLQKVFRIAPPDRIEGINPVFLPAYIPSRAFAAAMIDLLAKQGPEGQGTMQRIRSFLNAHHGEFVDNKAVEALLALMESTDGKTEKFQANLENWYNDAMDRVSGWYKKYSQNVLLVIGLLLAIGFNVDTIQVARTLWLDRDARQDMVNAASAYFDKQKTAPNTASAPSPGTAVDLGALQQNMQASVKAFQNVSTAALLPVGWNGTWEEIKDRQFGTWLRGFSTIAGWLITAAALSLGAPFWFDTLNKFMVVRSTIKPQEKSQPEASKD